MPLTRRQIYRRRRTVVFGGAVLVLGTAFYLPLTLLAPLPDAVPVELTVVAPAVQAPVVDFPPYGASGLGAIGYPGVLAQGGSTDPLPIASISKVVTALVVLDVMPLAPGEAGPDLTFTEIDEGFYAEQVAQNGVVASVAAGQVMSERNVLSLMLMASANNYAQSLAAWAFGSEAAYVDAAAAWLAREGLTATTIADATGINPVNSSTVVDLVALAKLAVAHPVVSEIVGTATLDIPGIGVVDNRNGLLGIDGVDGIKTGTLDEAGSCLLFSADRTIGSETVTLVGVVLGGPDHDTINAAIRGLLAQADAGFREITLTTAGDVFAEYNTPWGDAAAAVAEQTTTAIVWSNTPVSINVDVDPITLAPAGTAVGTAVFVFGDREVTVPLDLDTTIDDPGPWWRLTNPVELL
ncbi:MAG: D-alanyl-D-alanine carboxypeptidase family protein [Rhodoglobus sp.]